MLESDRHNRILQMLKNETGCTVHSLARALYVSEATIRRDLRELDRQGFVKRVYGGAIPVECHNLDIPRPVRSLQQQHAKRQIGQQAASLVLDGMVLFLDASTTAQALCEFIAPRQGITVITNGIRTAELLGQLGVATYCTGGLLLHSSLAYVGAYAENMVREFYADALFFSAAGVSNSGRISDRCCEEAVMLKLMLAQSKRRYFLCDGSKFGSDYCYQVGFVSEVDRIISNVPLTPELENAMSASSRARRDEVLPFVCR